MTARRLSPAELRVWCENWALWAIDRAGCYPVAYSMASAEGEYRCPQRNHHAEPIRSRSDPVRVAPAERMESVLSSWRQDRPELWTARVALKVQYVTASDAILRTQKASAWTAIRASRAHMAPRTYWDALNRAHARLSVDLWPHRDEFPRAAAANR